MKIRILKNCQINVRFNKGRRIRKIIGGGKNSPGGRLKVVNKKKFFVKKGSLRNPGGGVASLCLVSSLAPDLSTVMIEDGTKSLTSPRFWLEV